MSLPKTSTNFLSNYLQFTLKNPPKIAPPIPQKLTLPNPSLFYTKLNNIRNNAKQLEFVSDFDYTITKYRHFGRHCDSLFGMWTAGGNGNGNGGKDGDALPGEFVRDLIRNYREFGPYETDATISFQERLHLVGELYRFQTKLFEKYRITEAMAEAVLNNSNLVYRANTIQLLDILQQYNIPLYIISGGISDFVHNSLKALTKKQYRNISIHSNELEAYTVPSPTNQPQPQVPTSTPTQPQQPNQPPQQKKYIRFKKNLIHSYNKYKVMNHVNKRKNCFLMGDLVSDIYMAQGNNYENILSIFYAKQGENDQRAHAERKFDIIVEGDSSHRVIVELVKVINCRQDVDWEYLYGTGSNIHQLLM